jgi:uncharacterized protein involved in response to NO
MVKSAAPPDPYRIFFPLGIFLGLCGVLIWPLSYFGLLTGYWGASHAFIQSNGFLFCFIAGFLLTAVPRFTGTSAPSRPTQWTLALLITIGAIALELQDYEIGQTVFVATYAMLFFLVITRFLHRHGSLPETFSLIGIAVITGMAGAIVNALSAWNAIGGNWALTGKRSLTEGMTLLLVLGVGGFLGPRLLGFERLAAIQIEGMESIPKYRNIAIVRQYLYALAGIIILISIVTEYEFNILWMSYVRAVVATAVIVTTLEPWRLPISRTTLSWCVWTSTLFTIVALWLVAIFPQYQVDFLHVLFIGGFTLLILAVGMRVTLSHGGHGLLTEQRNWPIRIGLTLGLIAMLARAGAAFSPQSYTEHLAIAAMLWIIGLAIWGWRLLRLIVVRKA